MGNFPTSVRNVRVPNVNHVNNGKFTVFHWFSQAYGNECISLCVLQWRNVTDGEKEKWGKTHQNTLWIWRISYEWRLVNIYKLPTIKLAKRKTVIWNSARAQHILYWKLKSESFLTSFWPTFLHSVTSCVTLKNTSAAILFVVQLYCVIDILHYKKLL